MIQTDLLDILFDRGSTPLNLLQWVWQSIPQIHPGSWRFATLLILGFLLAGCQASTATLTSALPVPAFSTPNAAERDATAGVIERLTRQALSTLEAQATGTQSAVKSEQAFLATRDAHHAAQTAAIQAARATVQAWPQWPLAFADIFRTNQNRWREGTSSDDILTYHLSLRDGHYTWQIDSREDYTLTAWPAGLEVVADFHALAEGWFDPKSGAATLGIVFRQQDEQNFYYFGLANSETPRFVIVQNGGCDSVLFDEIPRTDEVHRLEVYAQASQFIFLVDNRVVGFANDHRFPVGRVGLGAQAFQQGGWISVEFRNFDLHTP
jgi:hypothetical protein